MNPVFKYAKKILLLFVAEHLHTSLGEFHPVGVSFCYMFHLNSDDWIQTWVSPLICCSLVSERREKNDLDFKFENNSKPQQNVQSK